ncbi:MAG: type II/IV secretion system protein [Gloeomargaritaceae cyanobacterium C42_A2020_066]|nr:type II/IV secretion system protein [Gloeomargaritaceae cyanobacterium C42_A2020_066]
MESLTPEKEPVTNHNQIWQQLCRGDIDCATALASLVVTAGNLHLDRLNPDLPRRFLACFPNRRDLPPLVPLLLWRNCYYLGSPETLTPETLAELSQKTRAQIKILPIAASSYRLWFRQTQAPQLTQIHASPLINPLTGEADSDAEEDASLFLSQADNAIHRINALISVALRHRASDIHLEPSTEGLRVRLRIDGMLRPIVTLPAHLSRQVVVAVKVMSNMDIAESRRPQDGRIGQNYRIDNPEQAQLAQALEQRNLDMRVSTLPCVGGEKVVIRLLPQENPFTCLEDLGFSPEPLATFQHWLAQPQGLVILTGPTGSGKTSTLYTSLQRLAKPEVNITTVEDPVEYVLPGITQTQVHNRAGMTFAAGLRSILRQDPDIIMVGEIRDGETAETVVRSALTGHLVLTTMHTIDTVTAIPRLKDLGPDPGLISDALVGVLGQRLVRRVCPHCAVPYPPTRSDLKTLDLTPDQVETQTWQKGQGCARCFQTGYLGRVAVVELLDADPTVRQLVYEGTVSQLRQYLLERGYPSFRSAAIEKLAQGVTTLSEIRRVLPYSALVNSLGR